MNHLMQFFLKHSERFVLNGVFCFLLLSSLLLCTEAFATDYFVSLTGNDQWSGLLPHPNSALTDGPFKTINRAKIAIRALKQQKEFKCKVTVTLASGIYYLDQSLTFNLLDSGFPGKEVLWQGEPGGNVIVSGGIPLDCEKGNGQIWECNLPLPPSRNTVFDPGRIKGDAPNFQFYVDGQMLQLARWPDQGWSHIRLPLDQRTKFSVMETLPNFSGDIRAAQIHIFPGNDWYDQYVGLDSANLQSNSITLASPVAYPLSSGRRFYIRNHPSFLDSPGEWFFNKADSKLFFIPLKEQIPQDVIVSSLSNILIADNVRFFTIKNIRFQHSTGSAIVLKDCYSFVLDSLDICCVGGNGVEIKNGQSVQLINSVIHQVGAGGVDVSGGNFKTLQKSDHYIFNNHIYNISNVLLTLTPSIELSGVGVHVFHNLLEYGPGIGVLISGNEHNVEKNELKNFCMQTSDCGAFYSGRNWSWRDNKIKNNYIADIIGYGMKSVDVEKNKVIYASPDGARGVYLDDGASGFEVTGNIFVNAGFMALQIGGGRDNFISNNYFETNEFAIWMDDRWPEYDWNQNRKNLLASPYQSALWRERYPKLSAPMKHDTWPEGNRIERNIIVTHKTDGLSFRYFAPILSTVITNNLVWSISGRVSVDFKILELGTKQGGASWDQWLAQGIEMESVVADPCARVVGNTLRLCSDSKAYSLGFKNLPEDIGLLRSSTKHNSTH